MVRLDEDPSRAQIVLVGALAIAFIVLGIVVVFNTSLYAENVDSTGTVSSVNQAEQVRHAGGDSVAGVAYRVNDGTFSSKATGAGAAVESNISNLSAVWQELNAQSSPVVANISFNATEPATDYGVRVYQDTTANFENRSNQGNWSLTPTGSTYSDVGRFEMTLERDSLETTPDDAFHLAALGGDASSGESWRVVRFVNDSGSLDVYVDAGSGTAPSGWEDRTGSVPAGCDDLAVGSTFDVEMLNGYIEGTSCTFEFTDEMAFAPGTDGYKVKFRDAGNVTGQYDAHLSTTAFDSVGAPAAAAPNYSYIVWGAGVDIEYGSPTASYTRTVTVPVYNSTR